MKRILLVAKTPLLSRLEPAVLARMTGSGASNLERLRGAAAAHEATLLAVRKALSAHRVNEWQIDRLQPRDAEGKDLVVTVGGDGTVLTSNTLDSELPMITVNSDPEGSIGVYTRCTGATFPALFAAWLAGTARTEVIPRLQVRIDSGPCWRILNECLVASANPAAVTRYLLEVPGPDGAPTAREFQRSSGVWVSTAAGSTAAIRSAGVTPVPAHEPALLYKVREPFELRGPLALTEGRQLPPRGLRLIPGMPGISLFIDGPYFHRGVPPGSNVDFSASPIPLRLVAPA